MNGELSFAELREKNRLRCDQVFHPLFSWTPTDWGCAMAGEAGEACNEIKKIRRGDGGPMKALAHQEALGKELADVVIYADLLAQRMGLNLGEEVVKKFNQVSRERCSTIFLNGDGGV